MFIRLLRPFSFALAIFLLSFTVIAQSNELRGRVVSVADGDTITVLDSSNTQHKIRFNGIDAPESKQDFVQVSKRNLSDLVFGKDVIVRWSKRDKYDRIIGTVMIGGTNANLEQLRAGMAWYYKDYERDVPPENRQMYARAEAEARSARRSSRTRSHRGNSGMAVKRRYHPLAPDSQSQSRSSATVTEH